MRFCNDFREKCCSQNSVRLLAHFRSCTHDSAQTERRQVLKFCTIVGSGLLFFSVHPIAKSKKFTFTARDLTLQKWNTYPLSHPSLKEPNLFTLVLASPVCLKKMVIRNWGA